MHELTEIIAKAQASGEMTFPPEGMDKIIRKWLAGKFTRLAATYFVDFESESQCEELIREILGIQDCAKPSDKKCKHDIGHAWSNAELDYKVGGIVSTGKDIERICPFCLKPYDATDKCPKEIAVEILYKSRISNPNDPSWWKSVQDDFAEAIRAERNKR